MKRIVGWLLDRLFGPHEGDYESKTSAPAPDYLEPVHGARRARFPWL